MKRKSKLIFMCLAFALLIWAGLWGIEQKLELPPATDINLYKAEPAQLSGLRELPHDLKAACRAALSSSFIRKHIPEAILDMYCAR